MNFKQKGLILNMLYLVGLGVWDEGDISLKGVKACKKADKVYAELYTSVWGGKLEKVEKIIKKKVTLLKRRDLEEKSHRLIKEAKRKNVVIMVPGDPLSATTHTGLMDGARKEGVEVEVAHSSSVFTAIAETGLSLYNFGKTVTVVAPSKKYKPDSFYNTIKENMDRGMHTLVLLDINMSVEEGLGILMGIERKKRKRVLRPGKRVVVASSIGSPKRSIKYGTVLELTDEDFPPPAVIVIPGEMNFFEKEFLEKLL
jgi:diphthine synthase